MKFLKGFAPLMVGLLLAAPSIAAESRSDAAWIPELGEINPSGPFRLWTAINKVLPEYASLKGGKELRSRIEGMSAGKFEDKTSGTVMSQTNKFREVLERIRVRYNLPKIKSYQDPLGRKITASTAFLNAGHILDSIVETLFIASNKSKGELGELYDVGYVGGKTPSDVFGLVNLATRRLQLIAGS